MLRLSILMLAITATVGWLPIKLAAAEEKAEKPARAKRAERAGKKAARGPQWHLAMQAYTYHKQTLFDAIDNTRALGIRYLEAFPGQKIRKDKDVRFTPDISPEVMDEVKKKLDDSGIKLVNYGVVDLGKDEASARKVFEFARKMGIRTIVAEPDAGLFDTLDKLTGEYDIRVAIHNHPKPSKYWNPQLVLDAIKGHSRRIGSCADTGHWPRSGVDPLEALKKLSGHIISLHFKDLNELNQPDAHDVPWGTGKCDAKAMLEELKKQGFSGVFSIEYEYNWDKANPEIEKCVKWFHATAGELGVPSD
ncbi:MAG: sugar phosphate isomerase/epimerase family protein [Phycisphaerae bacterium]